MALEPPAGFSGRFFTDFPVRSAYSEGAGPFRIVPAAVAMPADRSDVALLARWAADTATPLTPRGAGTGIPGNNVGAGVVVDLSFFERPLRVSLQQTANTGAAVTCAMLNQVGAHFGFRFSKNAARPSFASSPERTSASTRGSPERYSSQVVSA